MSSQMFVHSSKSKTASPSQPAVGAVMTPGQPPGLSAGITRNVHQEIILTQFHNFHLCFNGKF
jgi:hypothetical protein